MKQFEYRETKGGCRLCQMASSGKMIVIPFYYSGKSAPIMLCKECIQLLNAYVVEAEDV